MPDARNKEALLRCNLTDAGCDRALTEKCIRCFRSGTMEEMLPELNAHRKRILTNVHTGQKQIDCLDYLTNKIKSNEYEKEN